MKIIDYTQVVEEDAYANVGVYIVNLTGVIRAVGTLLTLEEFINRVLSIILRDCGRVDQVAGSCRKICWKAPQDQLEVRDHLLSLSKQKLRFETPTPCYMKTETNLSLSSFSSTGLLTAEGKHYIH